MKKRRCRICKQLRIPKSPASSLCPECYASPEQKQRRKQSTLQFNYGVTVEAYAAMLNAQGHCCAMCGEPFAAQAGQALGPAVDHDHASGKIRGIIHGLCNTRLGRFNDDIELLRKAVVYLERKAKYSGRLTR